MKTVITFLSLIFLSSTVFAETIHFKDGKTVNAKILQKGSSEVKVDLNGMTMTYYVDEIQDIDGQAIDAAAPKAPEETTSVSQAPQEKKALILKFIDVFGTRKAMTLNFETMINALSKEKPEDAKKIKEGFKVDEVIDRLVPLYDKHFTSEDLKVYIDFYSSERGQRLISSIGSIMRESVDVGASYLKEKFPEMVNEQ